MNENAEGWPHEVGGPVVKREIRALNKVWLTLQHSSCYHEGWDKIRNSSGFVR